MKKLIIKIDLEKLIALAEMNLLESRGRVRPKIKTIGGSNVKK